MLTIRIEQLQALAAVPLRVFEDRLVEHCRGYAPRLFELRGEGRCRQVVRTGLARAQAHGYTQRGPARFWVEAMLSFGHDFDTDPLLAWPRAALADTAAPQAARAQAMFHAMQDHLAAVEGPGKAHALTALTRVAAADWDRLVEGGAGFEASVLAAMAQIYPEKARHCGEPALRRLVAAAGVAAAARGIDVAAGRGLLAGVMFGFGHGVLGDPMYPWVADALDGDGDAAARTRRLAARTRTYVRAMLEHLGAPG